MRFVDFDIAFGPPAVERRDVNLRYRAFIEAVVVGLREVKVDAPWRKLFIGFAEIEPQRRWDAPSPKLGLSSAALHIALPDQRLVTTQGEAIRPLLAATITDVRDQIRSRSDWDDPWFWTMIDRVGSHQGPYRRPLKSVRDRSTKVLYRLTYEWDEAGTTLYLDAHGGHAGEDPLGRSEIGAFPGQWELLNGVVPTRIRLVPGAVDLLDHAGQVIASVARPG